MIIHKNSKDFVHLPGSMFSWHHEFLFPLPKVLFYNFDFKDRLLAWSDDRSDEYFNLGNLFWFDRDFKNIKKELKPKGCAQLVDKIVDNDNYSIRANTAHFDKCLKLFILLNEMIEDNDGYLYLEANEIEETIESYLNRNLTTLLANYDNLTINNYEHTDKLLEWVLNLESSKVKKIKYKGVDKTLDGFNVSTVKLTYEKIEFIPIFVEA